MSSVQPHDRYGLTKFTKALIGFVGLLIVGAITATILYLAFRVNESQQLVNQQSTAISEWSRRYLSLYDQYTALNNGNKPVALSPSSVQYLINTETKTNTGAQDNGSGPLGGAGTAAPPSWSYHIKGANGKILTITCSETAHFDPQKPVYDCK